ncbi:Fe-S_protein assembly chaperone HscA domain-containing protein [Hexamita inflata]|uniref:Fe-S protein assembly chaperone HscA domain-containing protein n=1 Tax=Hexamita inflata TaxID=28002 RepID=A0AA86UA46_9EUKA|nr:Fe-S protein assembly chaperone HscA domain-containing protein [Hexamita inflata]
MSQPINDQIRELIIDIRESSCIVTGTATNGTYCSLLNIGGDKFSYRLNQIIKTTLAVQKGEPMTALLNQEKPTELFTFKGFVQVANDKVESTNKINGEKLTLPKSVLIELLMEQMKVFTDANFGERVDSIQIVQNKESDQATIDLIIASTCKLYKLQRADVQIYYPKSMLSLDLGTGYYLAMAHDIQGQYELIKSTFCAIDGKMKAPRVKGSKELSTIYYKSSFDISSVPQLIARGDYTNIIANTSISVPVDQWIPIQHYKKYLYMANHEDLCYDEVMMCSNLQITIPTQDYTVDIMHVFLIIMAHIRYVSKDQTYDNIRMSVPISAQPVHFGFMKACAKYVFRGSEIDFTTEPEAAFSYLMTTQEDTTIFDGVKHIILNDGGDGTFDHVYVKLFGDVWSKQQGLAFNCAGTNIYEMFKTTLLKVFGKLEYDQLRTIDSWYDTFKKQTASKDLEELTKIDFTCLDQEYAFDKLIEEADNGQVFDVFYKTQKSNSATILEDYKVSNNKKKILQALKLVMKPEIVKNICSPINDFVTNFKTFHKQVLTSLQRSNETQDKVLVIFVGGLAANVTIQKRFDAEVKSYGSSYSFLCVEEPQVAIIKGIPVQRANISLRDFDSDSQCNLYMVMDKYLEGVQTSTKYEVSQNKVSYQYGPQTQMGNQIRNCPVLLLEKGQKLAPGNNKKIDSKKLQLNVPIDFTFYKTNQNVPQFFNLVKDKTGTFKFNQTQPLLRNENLFHKVVTICESDLKPHEANGLRLTQMLNKAINVEIHLVFDHLKFHPNPLIRVYGISSTKQKILLKEVEIWEWYGKGCVENPVTINKVQ